MLHRLAILGWALVGPVPASLAQSDLLVVHDESGTISRHLSSSGVWVEDWITGLDDPQALVRGPDGDVYVASAGTDEVRRYDGVTGDAKGIFVAAGAGGLSHPSALVFEASGDLLVASRDNARLLRFDGSSGSFVEVVAEAGFLSFPNGLALDAAGDIYTTDDASSRVVRVDPVNGAASIHVSDGSGGLATGGGLSFGPGGDLFVASESTHEVKRYDGATGAYLGNFLTAGDGGLDTPRGLHFGPDDGDLYVASSGTDQVKRYDGATGAYIGDFVGSDLSGVRQFGWREPVREPPLDLLVLSESTGKVTLHDGVSGAFVSDFITGLGNPQAITVGPDGNIYIANCESLVEVDIFTFCDGGEVLKFDGQTGAAMGVFVPNGVFLPPYSPSKIFNSPSGLAFHPNGDLYVLDQVSPFIFRIEGSTGTLVDQFNTFGLLENDLALGTDQNFYVLTGFVFETIRLFDIAAQQLFPFSAIGIGPKPLRGLGVGPGGDLFASSESPASVIRVDGATGAVEGTFVTDAAGGLTAARNLYFGPNDGLLYVASTGTDQIKRYDGATGAFVDDFVSGVSQPVDMAWRPNPLPNQPPVADAGGDRVVNEGAFTLLDGTASSDPDPGDVLGYVWTQTGGPPVSLDFADIATPGFTAPAVGPGGAQLTFELVVDDGLLSSAPDDVTVTVANVDQPPVAFAGPDQSVSEGRAVKLDGTTSFDPDGEALSFAWTQVEGPAVSLDLGDPSRPTFAAPAVAPGGEILGFELEVTANGATSPADRVDVGVSSPPTAAPLDCSEAVANVPILFPPDEELVLVTVEGVSGGVPPLSYEILSVTQDEPLSGAFDAALPSPSNDPGTGGVFLRRSSTGGNGRHYEITFQVTDSVGTSCVGSFAGCAPHNFGGVCVDDGQLFDSFGTQLPIADAGPDQDVLEGSAVTLDGTSSYSPSNGAIQSYAWTQVHGPSVALDLGDPARPTFTAPLVGRAFLRFELVVDDGAGPSAPDVVEVEVTPSGVAPLSCVGAIATPSEQFPPDNTFFSVSIDGVTGGAGPLSIEILSITQDEPLFANADAEVGLGGDQLRLRASISNPNGRVYEIDFRAIDALGASCTGVVTTCVPFTPSGSCIDDGQLFDSYGSQTPIALAGPDQAVKPLSLVTLDGGASFHPGNQAITDYAWTQVSGPGGAPPVLDLSDPARPTFQAPQVSSDGAVYAWELVVTADGIASAPDRVNVSVSGSGALPLDASGAFANLPTLWPPDDELVLVSIEGVTGGVPPLSYDIVSVTQDDVLTGSFDASLAAPTTGADGLLFLRRSTNVSNGRHYEVTFDVTDAAGATSSGVVTVCAPVSASATCVDDGPLYDSFGTQAPIADAGPDRDVVEGTLVTLDGNGSYSPSNQTIQSYAWTQVYGPSVTLDFSDPARPTFPAPLVERAFLRFELVVDDGASASVADMVEVEVTPSGVQQLSCAAAFTEPDLIYPPDNDFVPLTIEGVTGGSGSLTTEILGVTQDEALTGVADATVGPLEGHVALRAAVTNGNGRSYEVSFRVRDAAGATCQGVVGVCAPLVASIPCSDDGQLFDSFGTTPPIADAGPDQTVEELSLVTLDGTASFHPGNEPITTFNWTQVQGNAVPLNLANPARPTFVAPDASSVGLTLAFELVVGDGTLQSVADRVNLTVADFQSAPEPASPDPTITNLAQSCPRSIAFTPDGSGGYTVDEDPVPFAPFPAATDLALADDVLSAPRTLGFPFTMPGGAVVGDVVVDANGRVLAAAGAGSDHTASSADLADEPAALAPGWVDLNPAAGGAVEFFADPGGTFAAVTWNAVPQFGESAPLSFQVVLRDDDSFSFRYGDVSGHVGDADPGHVMLVGCSPGAGATLPAASDLAGLPLASAGEPTVFEVWDGVLGQVPDLQVRAVPTSSAALGETLDVTIEGLTANTLGAALLFGLANPALPLDGIGLPGCTLLTTGNLIPPVVLPIIGTTAGLSVPVPDKPSFVGALTLYLQPVVAVLEGPFVITEFGNGLEIAY